MNERIMLVDDDAGIRDTVAAALGLAGFDVETARTGEEALERLQAGGFDLVLLDVMLPGIWGTDVCRSLRSTGNAVPVIMLTARDAEVDRVFGLDLGADDYVTKPFSTNELISRARAIFRRAEVARASRTPETVRRVGGVELDYVRHEVRVDGAPARLTPSEFKLVELMATEPERVFSRKELMEHLSESAHTGDEHACDVHISNIRQKLERDPRRPARLVTVRALGYKLVPV